MIEKATLATADPHRGRFRSFMIGSLQNFVANWRDHELAHKRGGNVQKFSLDFITAEKAFHREPWTDLTPEKIFDRQWAVDLLNQVFGTLKDDYERSGKSGLFEKLQTTLTGTADSAGYAGIAAELHISVDAVKMSASRLRKRYRELLRQTIADTVASPEDVDDELRHLFTAFSN